MKRVPWGRIFFLIVPVFLYIVWYVFEYEKINILDEFKIDSSYKSPQDLISFSVNKEIEYETRKDSFPITLLKDTPKEEDIDLGTIVSQKITDVLSILPTLPIYKVCLRNNNATFLEGKSSNDVIDDIGAIGIKQKHTGLEWYAKINEVICKNVQKNSFLKSPISKEYKYVLASEIGPEDVNNVLQGKEYKIYTKSFRIDTADSSFILRLNFWRSFIPFYFLILLLWYPIFRQYLNIYEYVLGRWIRK